MEESNDDDQNLKAINASVGRLVWVRRRNGSWWPGQTLIHDQIPQNSCPKPKVGTPIKLLGRDDVNVDWYILENSKNVKAFRCGDYDSCIDKAKAAALLASSSIKKGDKCSLREYAINNALQIENQHLLPPKQGEETEDDDSDSEAQEQVLLPKTRRRKTPNDSEDDGTEGIKRMRGLEDIGKEQVGAVIEYRQENGCDVNLCGPIANNGKRKRSQMIIVNDYSKRKNRHQQLTKVLESTSMVSVPVRCDQLVTSAVSVVINNNSDSTEISCDKAKDNEISSIISVAAEDELFDVPLIGEDKQHSPGCMIPYSRRNLRSSNDDVFVKKEPSDGTPTQPTSEWQLKGKRNSRQMSKKQEARRNVNGQDTSLSLSLSLSLPLPLHEVKIQVKADSGKPHNVPLVSRMSKWTGKSIVGCPLTVENLEEGCCNGMLMPPPVVVKAESLPKKKKKKRSYGKSFTSKKKSSSLSKKTMRLSTLTSQKLTERSKLQTTETAKETVVACIPLKIVFSRINQVLKGSGIQKQNRALPSTAKT